MFFSILDGQQEAMKSSAEHGLVMQEQGTGHWNFNKSKVAAVVRA